jgi:hypothetical protein
MVIAARGDGLGARLCALVNAVALARRLNLPFRFMWPPSVLDPEFNAVSSLESVFSQSFIDDHLDDSLLLGEFIAIDREPVTRDMIEAVRRGDKKGLRIAHLEGPVSTQIGISISGSEIAKTFTELPFAEKIRSALRAADRGADSKRLWGR